MKYPLAAACLFFGLSFASWRYTGTENKKETTPVPSAHAEPTPEALKQKNS